MEAILQDNPCSSEKQKLFVVRYGVIEISCYPYPTNDIIHSTFTQNVVLIHFFVSQKFHIYSLVLLVESGGISTD